MCFGCTIIRSADARSWKHSPVRQLVRASAVSRAPLFRDPRVERLWESPLYDQKTAVVIARTPICTDVVRFSASLEVTQTSLCWRRPRKRFSDSERTGEGTPQANIAEQMSGPMITSWASSADRSGHDRLRTAPRRASVFAHRASDPGGRCDTDTYDPSAAVLRSQNVGSGSDRQGNATALGPWGFEGGNVRNRRAQAGHQAADRWEQYVVTKLRRATGCEIVHRRTAIGHSGIVADARSACATEHRGKSG